MDTDSEHTKGGIMSLAGVKVAPVLDVHLTPLGVLELQVLVCFSPALRLFEGESLPMDVGPAPTAVGWRFAIEHTITPQSDEQSTGLVPQGPQKAVVAIAAIPNNDVKPAFGTHPA